MMILKTKYLCLLVVSLSNIIILNAQIKYKEHWMDTLSKYYPNNVNINSENSKLSIEIYCNTINSVQLEDIAQYIRVNSQKYFFTSYFYWNNEKLYDARSNGEISLDSLPKFIQKSRAGYHLILNHSKFDIDFNFTFGQIKKIEYTETTNHEYSISGVSSTTYEKINFKVTTGEINCSNINLLLNYLNFHYSTGIKSIGEIEGLYDKEEKASKYLNLKDCSTTFNLGIISRNLKKVDLRTYDFSSSLRKMAPYLIVGGGLYGLKMLYDYATSNSYQGYNESSISLNKPENKIEYKATEWSETPIFGTSGSVDPERATLTFKCPDNKTHSVYIGRNPNYQKVYSTGTNICGFGHRRFLTFDEVVNASIDCKCNNK